MQYIFRMDMAHRQGQLTEPVEDLLLIISVLLAFLGVLDPLLEIPIFSELRYDTKRLLVHEGLVILYNIWVVEGL